jgi:hypothetical protein
VRNRRHILREVSRASGRRAHTSRWACSLLAVRTDERDVSVHQGPDVGEIHSREQIVELASLASRQRRLERQERVPGAVLDHHADQEEPQLELRSGNHERRYGPGRRQIGNLDGQVIVLRHVVADDELIVRVDMHEMSGAMVDAVRVIDARQLLPTWQLSVPEPKISEDPFESTGIRAKDEQIQIVLPACRSIEGFVALPMAVPDPCLLQGATEGRDELERPTRTMELAQRRAVPGYSRSIDARNVTRMHRAIPGWTDIGRVGTKLTEGQRRTTWHPVSFPLTCMLQDSASRHEATRARRQEHRHDDVATLRRSHDGAASRAHYLDGPSPGHRRREERPSTPRTRNGTMTG